MLDRLDETIVAVSSAPGPGSVGIIRLSGVEAMQIADRLAELPDGGSLKCRAGSTQATGVIRVDLTTRVPARFYIFRAPRSYTREDMIEIHTVGAPPLVEMVRRRAIDFGAIPAEPGEFTARAFLSGRMDLSSAEAVAGIIRAESDTQLRAARRMMDGELNRSIRDVRDGLGEILALVEADIDFAEEPIDFITPGTLRNRLESVTAQLDSLTASGATAERFDGLPRILLLGPPNAGKSTLMNRLSGTSRAICAALAGTTRDILSAPIRVGRSDAILLDAAGVDRSERTLDAQARAMTVSTAERVDLVCIVVDLSVDPDEHVRDFLHSLDIPRSVVAANKCDLVSDAEADIRAEQLATWQRGPVCAVSAAHGTGVDDLRQSMADALDQLTGTTLGDAVLLNERQRAAIRTAIDALDRATQLARSVTETIDCADLLAFELREALDALGTVTGEVTTDELLGQVFANFCIGK